MELGRIPVGAAHTQKKANGVIDQVGGHYCYEVHTVQTKEDAVARALAERRSRRMIANIIPREGNVRPREQQAGRVDLDEIRRSPTLVNLASLPGVSPRPPVGGPAACVRCD